MIKMTPVALVVALASPLIGALPAAADDLRFGPCPPEDPAPQGNSSPIGEAPVECGGLTVPLDHAEPNEATLSVAVSRIKASGTPSEYRGALLVNPGGPGGTGLDYAESKRAKMPESVQRSYDVIGFDPRGVGRSAPVDCGPLGGLFEHPGIDPVPTDPASEKTYLDGLRGIAGDCEHHIGAVRPHINTSNTARDMDLLRQALGEPKLNFLGVSYGTYLGAAYAAQFPERTGRMVLDSVVGPDDWHDFDVTQGFSLIEQRDVLFRWIADNPALGLGSTPESVRAHYLNARSALSAHPARGTFGPAEFDRLVYRTLSRTERWEPFARSLAGYVNTGDNAGFSPELPESGPESRNSESALRAVKCADSSRPDTAEVIGAVRALRSRDPQPVLTGLEATTCRFWERPKETTRFGHPDMPPVLLTQAAHDPTTPYAGARRMQTRLPGSRMVTLDNSYSHGAFASQENGCLDATAAAYLVDGTVPPHDANCQGSGLPVVGG